jgi:hypothetical protein
MSAGGFVRSRVADVQHTVLPTPQPCGWGVGVSVTT